MVRRDPAARHAAQVVRVPPPARADRPRTISSRIGMPYAPISGIDGFSWREAATRVRAYLQDAQPPALVEAQRVEVVVGGHQPQHARVGARAPTRPPLPAARCRRPDSAPSRRSTPLRSRRPKSRRSGRRRVRRFSAIATRARQGIAARTARPPAATRGSPQDSISRASRASRSSAVAGRTVTAKVCKGCTMRLCIFTEPQQGASYARAVPARAAHRRTRLRRVLPVRSLPAHGQRRRRARADRRVDHAGRARRWRPAGSGSARWSTRPPSGCPVRWRSRSPRST